MEREGPVVAIAVLALAGSTGAVLLLVDRRGIGGDIECGTGLVGAIWCVTCIFYFKCMSIMLTL